MAIKELYFQTAGQWRSWLTKNHGREKEGVWLVFLKKGDEKKTMGYEEALLEALCLGWIDSVIRNIDEEKYCRKFTPRRRDSKWSALNRKRVAKLIKEGRMKKAGFAAIEAGKVSGMWEKDDRPEIPTDLPADLEEALKKNNSAKQYFYSLAPSFRKQYIGWIVMAKKAETRKRRIEESISLLSKGQKLGLK